jgi:catechol 2,3-dioxygenase-like lactoylglutathione lyase family enzyme
MAVRGINHINIRTTDVAASVAFYVDVFGLTYGRSPMVMGQQGHWLHDENGDPIIHFRVMDPGSTATGPFDHVALNCTDKTGTLARLTAQGRDYSVFEGLSPGLTQVFVTDPHGVGLELNFTGE